MTRLENMLSALNDVDTLKRFGIKLHECGMVDLVKNCNAYQLMIKGLRDEVPFFFGPTNKDVATLALAIYQEEKNNFIEQDAIDKVNELLELDITYEQVQTFNSNYI